MNVSTVRRGKKHSGRCGAGETAKIAFICIVYPLLPLDTLIDPVSRVLVDLVDLVDASNYIERWRWLKFRVPNTWLAVCEAVGFSKQSTRACLQLSL